MVDADVDVHLASQASIGSGLADLLLQSSQIIGEVDIDIRILAIDRVDLHGDLPSLTAPLSPPIAGH